MPLAACGLSDDPPAVPLAGLPPIPADVATCFDDGPSDLPDRALSAAETEKLWKEDRRRLAKVQRCGRRALAHDAALARGWR